MKSGYYPHMRFILKMYDFIKDFVNIIPSNYIYNKMWEG